MLAVKTGIGAKSSLLLPRTYRTLLLSIFDPCFAMPSININYNKSSRVFFHYLYPLL